MLTSLCFILVSCEENWTNTSHMTIIATIPNTKKERYWMASTSFIFLKHSIELYFTDIEVSLVWELNIDWAYKFMTSTFSFHVTNHKITMYEFTLRKNLLNSTYHTEQTEFFIKLGYVIWNTMVVFKVIVKEVVIFRNTRTTFNENSLPFLLQHHRKKIQ